MKHQTELKAATIEGFSYSNKLVIGTELSWRLKEFSIKPEESVGDYSFVLKEGHNMTEGDVFKVKLLQNINSLTLNNFSSLYMTESQWGEFFLNDVSLGKNPAALNWYGPALDLGMLINVPIIPTTLQLSTGEKNYFDYMEEMFEAMPEDESEGFSVKNGANSFTMRFKLKGTTGGIFGSMSFESDFETVYNKEWGVLSRYELYDKISVSGETVEAKIVYEIENSEIQVPFNWMYSFIAIFITGAIVLVKRKK